MRSINISNLFLN